MDLHASCYSASHPFHVLNKPIHSRSMDNFSALLICVNEQPVGPTCVTPKATQARNVEGMLYCITRRPSCGLLATAVQLIFPPVQNTIAPLLGLDASCSGTSVSERNTTTPTSASCSADASSVVLHLRDVSGPSSPSEFHLQSYGCCQRPRHCRGGQSAHSHPRRALPR